MSKVKGIGGLIVVTIFGVFNGVYIFGPALKDHELQKLEHTSRTDTATSDVDQHISVAENLTSSSDVSSPAGSKPDSALPIISPAWSIPKVQNWKTFWMEGDRASQEKSTNSVVTKSGFTGHNVRRTTEDAVVASNSTKP
ncbi:hypothetical protein MMC15_002976 [Xylographa vitiligo]|nr:hypothetical protein [Xylographa vitiligo]